MLKIAAGSKNKEAINIVDGRKNIPIKNNEFYVFFKNRSNRGFRPSNHVESIAHMRFSRASY